MTLGNMVPFGTHHSRPLTLRHFGDLSSEMDRLFDGFLADRQVGKGLNVALDIGETEKSYLIHAEVPGLDEKNIHLELNDGILELSGAFDKQEEAEGESWHKRERRTGSFTRRLKLPEDADTKKVNAILKNGVLEVEIEKSKAKKDANRAIKIKTS